MKTTFIGLGAMGAPMAGHLLAKGHQVTVFNRTTAKAIAQQVGIEEVIAEVRPADKAGTIKALQQAGQVVAMVGDGVGQDFLVGVADVRRAVRVVDGRGDEEGFAHDGSGSTLSFPPQERMRALAPAASASLIWWLRT